MKESSFDQDMNGIDFDETDDFEVSRVALPFEMPSALDIQGLPDTVKKSGAVEALIQQNDDLMSRLGVSLRRVADLEDQVHSYQTVEGSLRSKYENLKDQVLVLKRKSQVLAERAEAERARTESRILEKSSAESQSLESLREQNQILEVRYNELLQSSQKKESKLSRDLQDVLHQASRLFRYRDRIRRAIFSFKKSHHSVINENTRLSKRLENTEATLADLRSNFLDATEYIKTQSKEQQIEIVAITKGFESELSSARAEINDLLKKNSDLSVKAAELEVVLGKATELENELILTQRKFEDFRLQSATEQSDLQKSLARYRSENRDLALELDATRAEHAHLKSEFAATREGNFKLSEQVENLQSLWKDQNFKFEKVSSQNQALQKLNQELSITINRYRKDLRELRERSDFKAYESTTMTTPTTLASDSKALTSPSEPKNTDTIILDKIDKVLAGMQIGG